MKLSEIECPQCGGENVVEKYCCDFCGSTEFYCSDCANVWTEE